MVGAYATLVTIILIGCGNNEFIRPENLHHYTDRPIEIQTQDSSLYRFLGGEWTLDNSGSDRIVQGRGLEIRGTDTLQHETASISLKNVGKVHVTEERPEDTLILVLVSASLAASIFALVAMSFSNMH